MKKVVNIKVIGAGGAGNSVLVRMIASGINDVTYFASTPLATPSAHPRQRKSCK